MKDAAYTEITVALKDELLSKVLEASPTFLEKLIVKLLVSMGYDGSRTEAGKHIGKSGDGGVDGVINEDKLGLDIIYIQANQHPWLKQWHNEIDLEFGERLGDYYEGFLSEELRQLELSRDELLSWQLPAGKRGGPGRRV